MSKVIDHLWLWCHQAASHDGQFGLPGPSSITPAAALDRMGLSNAVMVCYAGEPHPPFAPHAEPLRSFDRLVWSVVGDSLSKRNDTEPDLDAVIALAEACSNLVGGILDDFFHMPEKQAEKGLARYSPEAVAVFRERLHHAPRPLELWVAIYEKLLDAPLSDHLALCDVITFWTWEAQNLPQLEANFEKLERLAPKQRKMLGCYMWDYCDSKPMLLEAIQHQCRLGLDWLQSGRIDGIIFLASNLCGLDLETVTWTRDWIAEVGKMEVSLP